MTKIGLFLRDSILFNKAFVSSIFLVLCAWAAEFLFNQRFFYEWKDLSHLSVTFFITFYLACLTISVLFFAALSSIPRIGWFLTAIFFLTFTTVSWYYNLVTGVPVFPDALWLLVTTPLEMMDENCDAFFSVALLLKCLLPGVVILALGWFLFFKLWKRPMPKAWLPMVLLFGAGCVITLVLARPASRHRQVHLLIPEKLLNST